MLFLLLCDTSTPCDRDGMLFLLLCDTLAPCDRDGVSCFCCCVTPRHLATVTVYPVFVASAFRQSVATMPDGKSVNRKLSEF